MKEQAGNAAFRKSTMIGKSAYMYDRKDETDSTCHIYAADVTHADDPLFNEYISLDAWGYTLLLCKNLKTPQSRKIKHPEELKDSLVHPECKTSWTWCFDAFGNLNHHNDLSMVTV